MEDNVRKKLYPLLEPRVQELIIAWFEHREKIALNQLVYAKDPADVYRAQGRVLEAREGLRMRDYIKAE